MALAAGWLANWGYRQEMVVNPTMTAADLTDFPLLVSITDSSHGVFSGAASPLGHDIIFTTADGVSVVPHEIESFNASGGSQLAAWVKTNVSSTAPTTLYMYYGNHDGVDYQQVSGTWNSGYRAVHHFQGDPLGTSPQFSDSTSLNNHGTVTGATPVVQAPGQIAGSLQLDGGGGYVSMAGNSSLEITDQLTLSAWIRPDASDGKLHSVIVYGHAELSGYNLAWDDRNTPDSAWFSANDTRPHWNTLQSQTNLEPGQWYHLAATYTPTKMEVFVNGQSKGTRTPNSTLGGYDGSTVRLGGGWDSYHFDGQIDEARISDVARDASWFQASYNNQSDPNGMVGLGASQSREDVLDGWMYRQGITISKDVTRRNPGDAGVNLADFPIPIRITDASHAVFSHAASPEGRDIVFTSGDGVTRLPYELEYFSDADGSQSLYAWVQAPLSADADTLVYMYFDGPEQDNTTSTAVWDNRYKMVQHLSGNPAGTAPQFRDSTAYANHGTAAGGLTTADQVAGKFDGALALGTNKHVSIANNPSLLLTGPLTLEGWMKIDQLDGYIHSIVGFSENELRGYKLAWDNRNGRNDIWFCVNDNRVDPNNENSKMYNTLLASYAFGTDQWYHIAATYDGTLMRVYVDGQLIGTRTSLSVPGAYDSSSIYIGRWSNFWFPGQLDEIRISDIARDPDWILANYRLLNSPDAYLTFGHVALVPEPASVALLGLAAVALLLGSGRRPRSRRA